MAKFQYTITEEDAGLPIKKLIRQKFNFSSRLLTKLKFQHLVFLNDDHVDGWITPKPGDILSIELPEETSHFDPEDIPIDARYEDDDLLIINKQRGIIVHPTKGHPTHTLANGLMKFMLDSGKSYKIRFVNRLDMDTTGLLIVAKNSHSQADLSRQMKENLLEKRYLAVVQGIVEDDSFTIDLPLGRPDDELPNRAVMEEGLPSVTHVKVLERYPGGNGYSLVECLLETGRTHQIRVHLSHMGHPIVGDYLYGGDAPWLIDRQALHAYKLTFDHPVTGKKLTVEAPLPDDIQKVIEEISKLK